jgi:hypothetical protein
MFRIDRILPEDSAAGAFVVEFEIEYGNSHRPWFGRAGRLSGRTRDGSGYSYGHCPMSESWQATPAVRFRADPYDRSQETFQAA